MDVEMPDGTVIQDVPEGTTKAQLSAKYQAHLTAATPPAKPSGYSGILDNALGFMKRTAGIAAAPVAPLAEPVISGATSMAAMPVAGIAGAASAPFIGSGGAANVIDRVQSALTYQPRTQAGQAVNNVVTAPMRFIGKGADAAGGYVAEKTGSPLLGAAVNTAIQSAPALLARGKVGRGSSSIDRPGNPVAEGAPEAPSKAAIPERQAGLGGVPEKPPTIEELRTLKDEAYKRADESGIVVSGSSFEPVRKRIATELNTLGMDSTLHPDASAALKKVLSAKGDMTLTQLETLRRVASDAKGSIKPADSMRASRIVNAIDDYIDNLKESDVVAGTAEKAAALKEARGYNTRLMKAEEISTLIDRAGISAQGFSGSGFENALRVEFRGLAKNANRMRRFSPEEQAAIRKVAMGGPLENTLRYVGKLAPTGGLSTMLNLGLVAGTGGGGLAVPIIGTAGRMAATRMTMKNATAAEELMRAGNPQRNALATKKPQNALISQ